MSRLGGCLYVHIFCVHTEGLVIAFSCSHIGMVPIGFASVFTGLVVPGSGSGCLFLQQTPLQRYKSDSTRLDPANQRSPTHEKLVGGTMINMIVIVILAQRAQHWRAWSDLCQFLKKGVAEGSRSPIYPCICTRSTLFLHPPRTQA